MNWKIAVFCVAGGLLFTIEALKSGHFGWMWLDGVVTCACLVPVVRFGPRNVFALFGTIAPVLVVVGIWCTLSEGMLFLPEQKAKMMQSLGGGTVVYLLVAAVIAALAWGLKLSSGMDEKIEPRSAQWTAPMFLLTGFSYLVYYEVFGGLAFILYTRQFYPHAAEQVAALGVWFPVYQWGRGLMMTLAALPMIYTLRMKRWQAALVVGVVVWIVGGGGPLLVPMAEMVTPQRYAHIVEIMTQNVALGATAVLLLRRRQGSAVGVRGTAMAA